MKKDAKKQQTEQTAIVIIVSHVNLFALEIILIFKIKCRKFEKKLKTKKRDGNVEINIAMSNNN